MSGIAAWIDYCSFAADCSARLASRPAEIFQRGHGGAESALGPTVRTRRPDIVRRCFGRLVRHRADCDRSVPRWPGGAAHTNRRSSDRGRSTRSRSGQSTPPQWPRQAPTSPSHENRKDVGLTGSRKHGARERVSTLAGIALWFGKTLPTARHTAAQRRHLRRLICHIRCLGAPNLPVVPPPWGSAFAVRASLASNATRV
jgi:hypothetical protein